MDNVLERPSTTIDVRMDPMRLFPSHVFLADDEVISLTIAEESAVLGITNRRRNGEAMATAVSYGRIREIPLTTRTGYRTARLDHAIDLAAKIDVAAEQADLRLLAGAVRGLDNRRDARARLESREIDLLGAAADKAIDSTTNSGVVVWRCDNWITTDEAQALERSDEDLELDAWSENVALIDIAAWRHDARARFEAGEAR